MSAGSEGASSTVRSRRCISGSSSRMLSCRHSIGHRPPLETLVRGSKSVPHFRCYASPPPTKTCARAILYEAKLETDTLHRAGQDRGSTGRAIAVLGQLSGDLVIAFTLGKEHPNLLRHLVRARQVGEGPDSHGDLNRGGLAATPDNAGV